MWLRLIGLAASWRTAATLCNGGRRWGRCRPGTLCRFGVRRSLVGRCSRVPPRGLDRPSGGDAGREHGRGCRLSSRGGNLSRKQLDALIEQATVDCYDEDEQLAGLFAMIGDNLAVPFQTTVLGVEVTVEDIDLTNHTIVAYCRRGAHRQAIGVLDLPLAKPPPEGTQWIEAYRHWAS